MHRKFAAGLLALLLALGFSACGNGGEGSSEPSSSISSSEPGSGSSGSSSESTPEDSSQPEDSSAVTDPAGESSGSSADEGDSHAVILCNGTGSDVTGLRIRETESEYWSFEILGGESWASGSSIELDLSREEWEVDGGWEVEVTFPDSGTVVYEIPLGEYGIVELQPDGAFEGE